MEFQLFKLISVKEAMQDLSLHMHVYVIACVILKDSIIVFKPK